MLVFTVNSGAATLQETVNAAVPGEAIRVQAGAHPGPIIIKKSLTLIGEPGSEIRGNETGNVVTIAADDVTLRGLRITGSGLRLSDDDAAIFVTGNHAIIENCVVADSLHGIYLKTVSGARILNNRIQGKTKNDSRRVNRVRGKGNRPKCRKLRHDPGRKSARQWNSPMELRRKFDPWQRDQRYARRHLFFVH